MNNFNFNVNSEAVIHLTARLERIKKSSFPSAIRATLNDGAFEMKKTNIGVSAGKNMTVRNKTVFKKFTGVERATYSSNVENMKATVGFIPKDGVKGSKVPEGMEKNEVGGTDDTGAMYLPKTRISGSAKRLVRNKSRFKKSNILNVKNVKNIKTKKSLNFVQLAYESFSQKKAFYFNTKKGLVLAQTRKFSETAKGNSKIKLDFLMRDRKKFKAKAKATHFNKEAAQFTQKQMDGFYHKNAEFHFAKQWK